MKMRYVGRSVSNRYCEILLRIESGAFDMHQALRCARDASKKMDFYVKYVSRVLKERNPHVYIKYSNDCGGTNFAYIMVRDTLQEGTKKIVIRNSGFKKADLEILADLILDELKASGERSTQPKSQPGYHEQLSLFQPEKLADASFQPAAGTH